MGAKERAATRVEIGQALKDRPSTWSDFTTWLEGIAERVREVADDYDESYQAVEGYPGLAAKWEEEHGDARAGWGELVSDLEGADITDFGGDVPALEEDDTAESFWQGVEEWVGGAADEVTARVEAWL